MATSAFTPLRFRSASDSSRSSGSVWPGVGPHVVPALAQQPRGVDGGGDRERVDDARARQVVEVAEQPGEAGRGVGEAQHAESQRRAGEGPPDREHLGAAELLGDIRHHPAVRRGGGRQHRHVGRHLRDEVAEPAVVGTEVVAPVADAVRLVDDEQSDAAHERGELLLAERRVVEPLGGDEQHVDLVGVEPAQHVGPLVRVRRVDRHGAHARPLGGGDLVAHEREQRGHEHGRPGASAAQQQRRDEVHRRLAPPGALHDERAAPAVDERLDGLELPVVEFGVGAAHEFAERGEGRTRVASVTTGAGGRHAPTPPIGRHAPGASTTARHSSGVALDAGTAGVSLGSPAPSRWRAPRARRSPRAVACCTRRRAGSAR